MENAEITSKDKSKVESVCICRSCPSYFDCGEPLGFCFYGSGASSCITVKRGCICPACPVHEQSNLELDFYCTEGSEEHQKQQ